MSDLRDALHAMADLAEWRDHAGQMIDGILWKLLPAYRRTLAGPARALRAVGDRAGAAADWTADGKGDRIVDQVMAKGDAVGNAEWVFGCSAGRSYKPRAIRAISWFPDSQRP
jgi:hypothetical protein